MGVSYERGTPVFDRQQAVGSYVCPTVGGHTSLGGHTSYVCPTVGACWLLAIQGIESELLKLRRVRSVNSLSAAEQRGSNLKSLKDFYLKVKDISGLDV